MQIPLELAFRNVRKDPKIKALIRKQVTKLDKICPHMVSCRVSVERPQEHQRSGSPFYNMQLSRRRAEAVRDLLIQSGISADRIVAQGMGESYPVASNATKAGRLQNRRIEIIIFQGS